MADTIVVNLPPMPNPRDFGVDKNTHWDTSASLRYKDALKAWEAAAKAVAEAAAKK